MTSTATAAVKPCCQPVVSPQPSSVSSAMTRTTGTNTAETRSASRCTGALPLCAAVTSAVMRASAVSLPTRVARSTSRPSCTTVPPETESPGPTSTGTDSPVSMLASIADEPSTTSPSVAMRSPGSHDDEVADLHVRGGDVGVAGGCAHPRNRRCQVEQRAQRGAGATLRPLLEPAPDAAGTW